MVLYPFYKKILGLLKNNSIPIDEKTKREITSIFYNTTRVVLIGNLTVAAVQGFLIGIIFLILGISYPMLTTGISFVLSILPLIGAAFVWLPVSIYYLQDPR